MIDQADNIFLKCEPTSFEGIGIFRINNTTKTQLDLDRQ